MKFTKITVEVSYKDGSKKDMDYVEMPDAEMDAFVEHMRTLVNLYDVVVKNEKPSL